MIRFAYIFAVFLYLFTYNEKTLAIENSYKLYAVGGTGYSSIGSYGAGFSYAGYYNIISDNMLHTFDINLFLLGIHDYEHAKNFNIKNPDFQMNLFIGYGIGFTTSDGTKITFDVIGLGLNVTTRDDTAFYPKNPYTKIGTLANAIGIQVTMPNGLYVAWRNTFTGYNWRTREDYRQETLVSDAGEIKSLFIIGYDFSSLAK